MILLGWEKSKVQGLSCKWLDTGNKGSGKYMLRKAKVYLYDIICKLKIKKRYNVISSNSTNQVNLLQTMLLNLPNKNRSNYVLVEEF